MIFLSDFVLASKQLKGVLTDVYEAYEAWQEEERKVMGFNLAGLEIMSREVRENESSGYLDEPVEEYGDAMGKGLTLKLSKR